MRAFKTGAGANADLLPGGFDTHTAHDAYHGRLPGALTDSVDFLWDYVELRGVAAWGKVIGQSSADAPTTPSSTDRRAAAQQAARSAQQFFRA